MKREVRPRLLTALCYAAMMCLAIGINLLPVFLTSIGASFGDGGTLNREELGRLGAVAFAGLVSGIVATGPLADRHGAKPFVILANVLTVLGLAGMAAAATFPLLLVAVFVVGLGAGMLDMILSPVVAALNPERRTAAMNWLHSFYPVGAVVTILIGTLALAFDVGWRVVCLISMALPLGLTVLFLPMRFPDLVADRGRKSMRELSRHAWFLGVLAAIFLAGAIELGMAQWLPAYAETTLGFSPTVSGTALLSFSVAMAVGRMAVGALEGSAHAFAIMAVGGALSGLLFLLGAFLENPTWALVACIATGLSGTSLWPTILAVAADRYPDGGASMFAALAAVGNAGGILMPWIIGYVGDVRDLHWGMATSAVAPLALLPLLMLLLRGEARK